MHTQMLNQSMLNHDYNSEVKKIFNHCILLHITALPLEDSRLQLKQLSVSPAPLIMLELQVFF